MADWKRITSPRVFSAVLPNVWRLAPYLAWFALIGSKRIGAFDLWYRLFDVELLYRKKLQERFHSLPAIRQTFAYRFSLVPFVHVLLASLRDFPAGSSAQALRLSLEAVPLGSLAIVLTGPPIPSWLPRSLLLARPSQHS